MYEEGANSVKSKRVGLCIVILILIGIVIVGVALVKSLGEKKFGLKESVSFFENISDFAVVSSGEPDELTKAFLKKVEYRIINIDKKNKTASVEVKVPIISNQLSDILDGLEIENEEVDYEELKQTAEDRLASAIESAQTEFDTEIITFSIEKIDGDYKLVATEEWNEFLIRNLEDMYRGYLKTLIGGMTNEVPE